MGSTEHHIKFVSKRAKEITSKKDGDYKVVTCHLGQGASICAIKNGNQ